MARATALFVSLVLLYPATAAAEAPPSAGTPAEATAPPAAGQTIASQADVGAPIAAANLVIYPLVTRAGGEGLDLLTLDEAMERKLVKVTEKSSGGTVNTLKVSNSGDKPVFAMTGELLLGGKQDRIVARNTVIPAGARELDVAVFCVEHGRWNPKTDRFGSAKTLAHKSLRQVAFKGSQGGVWAEVSKTNAARGTDNATDTYREAAAKEASDAKAAAATRQLLDATRPIARMAGFVAAIDGELQAVEWFASPRLYRKVEDKLVRSYVAEALDAADGKAHPVPAAQAANDFVERADEAPVTASEQAGAGKVFGFDDAEIEGQMNTLGEGRVVQKSYMKKKPATAEPSLEGLGVRNRPHLSPEQARELQQLVSPVNSAPPTPQQVTDPPPQQKAPPAPTAPQQAEPQRQTP